MKEFIGIVMVNLSIQVPFAMAMTQKLGAFPTLILSVLLGISAAIGIQLMTGKYNK